MFCNFDNKQLPEKMISQIFRWPVLKILLPFLGGILTVILGFKEGDFPFWPLLIAAIIGFLTAQKIANRSIRWFWVPGPWLTAIFYLLGLMLTTNSIEIWDQNHFANQANDSTGLLVKVIKPPTTKSKSIHFEGSINYLLDKNGIRKAKGKVWVYLPKSKSAKQVNYGDLLYCSNEFQTIKPPPNPEQFNLKTFLANQQIYHQAFFDQNEWSFTGRNRGNPIFKAIYTFKGQVKKWLKKAITRPQELDVAKALVLGKKSDIDPELRKAYAGTGAMHVLAVSGLHVGIIYMILNYAFSFLNLLPKGKAIKILIIIWLLWIYALLTGLSPSVFRASTMFTFVTIGQNLRRYTNVFSSIIVSMIVLLAYDPFLITQVGFQLSYAAVIGIVTLQPRIYNLLPQSRYWALDQIWALTAVSIAAQIATFPLTIFYFNMFPSYFFLSNLVVIPAAFLIVTNGFIFMVVHVVNLPSLEYLADLILDWLLWLLNKSIFWVQDLPMAVINELYISTPVLLVLYGIILSGAILMIKQGKLALFLMSFFLLAWGSLNAFQNWQQQQMQKIALFKAGNHSLINIINSGEIWMLGQKGILSNENQLKFHTYRYFWQQGLRKADINKIALDSIESRSLFGNKGLKIQLPLIELADFRIALIRPGVKLPALKEPITVDWVLLMNNPKLTLKELQKTFDPTRIVAGADAMPWNSRDWKNACREEGYKYYNMDKNGALVENL